METVHSVWPPQECVQPYYSRHSQTHLTLPDLYLRSESRIPVQNPCAARDFCHIYMRDVHEMGKCVHT